MTRCKITERPSCAGSSKEEPTREPQISCLRLLRVYTDKEVQSGWFVHENKPVQSFSDEYRTTYLDVRVHRAQRRKTHINNVPIINNI